MTTPRSRTLSIGIMDRPFRQAMPYFWMMSAAGTPCWPTTSAETVSRQNDDRYCRTMSVVILSTDNVGRPTATDNVGAADLSAWAVDCGLKTEFIWLGIRFSSAPLQLKGQSIMPVSKVRDLGVVIDSELSMDAHTRNVVHNSSGIFCTVYRRKLFVDCRWY